MTDLKHLLEQAAGEEPAITDDDLQADLRRGQRSARRRQFGAAVAGVAATALVITGGWAFLPDSDQTAPPTDPGVASSATATPSTRKPSVVRTDMGVPDIPSRPPMKWAAQPVPLVRDGKPAPGTNAVCDLKPKGWKSHKFGPNSMYYRDPTSTYPHKDPPMMSLGWEVGDGTTVMVGPFGDKVGNGWKAQVNAHVDGKEAAVFDDVQQGKNRPLEIFVRLDSKTTVQVGIGPRSGWDTETALRFAASCHLAR